MKNILRFEDVQSFEGQYPGNPNYIDRPVPGVAYVADGKAIKYNSDGYVYIKDYQGNVMKSFPMKDGHPFNISVSLFEELSGSTPTEGSGQYEDFYLSVDKNLIDVEKTTDGSIVREKQGTMFGVYIPASWYSDIYSDAVRIDFTWGQDTPGHAMHDYQVFFNKDVIKNGQAVITAKKSKI